MTLDDIINAFIRLYYAGVIVNFLLMIINTILYVRKVGKSYYAALYVCFHPFTMLLNLLIAGGSWFAIQYLIGDIKKLLE